MIARFFSPSGRTRRMDYLSIFLIWASGTIFVMLVANDLRTELSLTFSYLAVAMITGLLAWLQICGVIRRLQDLNWSWLLALPWIPITLWPVSRSFAPPAPLWLEGPFALYGIVTCGVFLFRDRPSPIQSQSSDSEVAVAQTPVAPPPPVVEPQPVQLTPSYSHPLVGWLVELDGDRCGTEYRLHARRNPRDSDPGMEVGVAEGHGNLLNIASIRYDPQETQFSVSSVSPSVRLNGYEVPRPSILSAYDRLQIGQMSFIFVPLCGVYHRWAYSNSQAGAASHV
jgi:uncharacterized membrane protein YhaH (DUF805 family)